MESVGKLNLKRVTDTITMLLTDVYGSIWIESSTKTSRKTDPDKRPGVPSPCWPRLHCSKLQATGHSTLHHLRIPLLLILLSHESTTSKPPSYDFPDIFTTPHSLVQPSKKAGAPEGPLHRTQSRYSFKPGNRAWEGPHVEGKNRGWCTRSEIRRKEPRVIGRTAAS